MLIAWVLGENHIKEVELQRVTERAKRNVGHQTEEEWKSGDENHSWGNRSISGQSNESHFPSGSLSFSSCRMQIHGPLQRLAFSNIQTHTYCNSLYWIFLVWCCARNKYTVEPFLSHWVWMWSFVFIVNCRAKWQIMQFWQTSAIKLFPMNCGDEQQLDSESWVSFKTISYRKSRDVWIL